MSGEAFGTGTPVGACPCGSLRPYAVCCGPLHAGERSAVTAEELMRSRYTAFAVGDEAYLLRTWHPRTRPDEVAMDRGTTWTGLSVRRSDAGGAEDAEGLVEFVATWRDGSAAGGAGGELHEVSRFVRRAGRWLYLDGDHG